MMRRQWIEGLMMAAGLLLGAGNRADAAETWVDLTHPFNADTIFWPTENGFQFDPGTNGPTPKGYYYAANRFTTAEHGGTHLDVDHFVAGGEGDAVGALARVVPRGGAVGAVVGDEQLGDRGAQLRSVVGGATRGWNTTRVVKRLVGLDTGASMTWM